MVSFLNFPKSRVLSYRQIGSDWCDVAAKNSVQSWIALEMLELISAKGKSLLHSVVGTTYQELSSLVKTHSPP